MKVKVPAKTMNKLIKIMATKQNKKFKLNAGQYREVLRCFFESLVELDATEFQSFLGGQK